ncbi:cell surface GPI-anchored protein ECM33 [[Candida] anglica]
MKFHSVLAGASAIGLAFAADSSSCSFSSTTITAATGVEQLNACPTIAGDIEVTGDQLGNVDLSSVEEISGNIKLFNSSSVTAINLNQLGKISGSLSITALTQLFSVDLSSLDEVETLSLVSLPSFATLNINKGISKASSIELSDTALSTLNGFTTTFNTIGSLNVNNNKNISTIDLSNLNTVSQGLILSFNNDNCTVDISNLNWASNLTIQDVSEINASNLTSVNGTFNIAYNTFKEVEFDNLKEVGGAFQFYANDDVNDIAFDKLETIGGEFRLFNNTDLQDMNSTFPKLSKVKGAVNVQGVFGNFTLPDLSEVNGDFTVITTDEDFSCDDFDNLHSKSSIEGHNYTCSAPTKSSSQSGSKTGSGSGSKSTGSGSSDSSSSSGSSSFSGKKSEGNNLRASYIGVLFTVIGGIFVITL